MSDRILALRDRIRAVPWLTDSAPRGLSLVLGIVAIVVGLFLILRPLSAVTWLGVYIAVSCIVSGVADLLTPAHSDPRRVQRVGGVLWILAGITGLVWWGRLIDYFVPAVAIILVVSGALHVFRLVIRRSWETLALALFGLAEILFGVLTFSWPDVSLIVIGALFGGRTVAFGVILLARAGNGQREHSPEQRQGRAVIHVVLAALLLVVATGTALVGHALRNGPLELDGFYATPATLPDEPGVLIRTAPYDHAFPDGMRGVRIYYTTTDRTGKVVPASGFVAVPEHATRPVPLITWAHGTVGIARGCAPSAFAKVYDPDLTPAADKLAQLGWGVVGTDYAGMGADGPAAYLVGQTEGRSVLDAARAARQVRDMSFTDDTVIWGHSQGGHAALWAGQLTASYAPDLHVVGTAALAPASDPRAMADAVLSNPGHLGVSLAVSYVATGYIESYPDLSLDSLTAPGGRTLIREAASRCTGDGGTLATILTGLSIAKDTPLVDRQALTGRFGELLDQNMPTGPWNAPLFIGQGEADEVIPYRINVAYVDRLCASGTTVDFVGYPGGDHMSILKRDSRTNADVIAWTRDRLEGEPAPSTCPA
ncbi:lipase family protein [Gordonia sp. CPCC 206044]|uniref:lipase family protein n=1 Tax=Gordonia sp. CPCC 206044 TaxID=3140793 RepID=UPI003AF3D840